MRLNNAIIKEMVIDGNQYYSLKEFISKLKEVKGLAMDVYVNTKLIWSGPARLRLDNNWLIAYSNTQISFTESVGVESIVARIRQSENILFESVTSGDTIIPANDTVAIFYVGLLSDSPYNCLKKRTPDSKFIPKLTSKLPKVVFDEIERTINDDIEEDTDVSVWKLSVDPLYKFTENMTLSSSDLVNPEYPIVLYNYNESPVMYEDGMNYICRRTQDSYWSSDVDYSAICNPDIYYGYKDSADAEPTQNYDGFVCVTILNSYTDVSGVIIYKVKDGSDIEVDVVNCYIEGVATPILVYESNGVTYYNLATLDNENSTAWVTAEDLPDYVSLTID